MKKFIWLLVFASLVLVSMIFAFLGVVEKTIGIIIALVFIIAFDTTGMILAKKEKVSMIFYIMLAFTLISIVLLVLNIISYNKLKSVNTFNFTVTSQKNNSSKTFLFTSNGNSVYSYNLSNINIKISNDSYTIKEAFEKNKITFDKLKDSMVSDKKESGFELYRDGEDEGYALVFCSNNAKKGDIIFVPVDYKYEEKICS